MDSTKVELIQSSVTEGGTRIDTFILEYPRAIHSQLLTHRVFSKNSSSTRAVPIPKVIEQIEQDPAKFIWTHNQSGMQGSVVTDPTLIDMANTSHNTLFDVVKQFAELMNRKPEDGGLGLHKQNVGRYLEPFQNIRVCLTSTEWENWDWLRIDPDAQPEIRELATKIKEARDSTVSLFLLPGEWHVPFVDRKPINGRMTYWVESEEVSLTEAINISMSCCAQTSYRKLDVTKEKAEDMIPKLFGGRKVHASPSEHQATPMDVVKDPFDPDSWQKGITHVDRKGNLWSGNFRHWIQNRQLIPNHDSSKRGISTCD